MIIDSKLQGNCYLHMTKTSWVITDKILVIQIIAVF